MIGNNIHRYRRKNQHDIEKKVFKNVFASSHSGITEQWTKNRHQIVSKSSRGQRHKRNPKLEMDEKKDKSPKIIFVLLKNWTSCGDNFSRSFDAYNF